jgi:hypothetical protein
MCGDYANEWKRLVDAREEIAHMNPYRAVKSMQGHAKEKYHAMCHKYPTRMPMIEKFGYDPKQLHHLLRIQEYLKRYVVGYSYEECLKPSDSGYLIDVKRGLHSLEDAKKLADAAIVDIDEVCQKFFEIVKKPEESAEVRELLDDVQYNIMRIAVAKELK